MPDIDCRIQSGTEQDGSTITYGYDWGSRLTSEVRTGTNPYSISYGLDLVGNRTSQTVGAVSTAFSYSDDDELTAAVSPLPGGFNNTYGYNLNGEPLCVNII